MLTYTVYMCYAEKTSAVWYHEWNNRRGRPYRRWTNNVTEWCNSDLHTWKWRSNYQMAICGATCSRHPRALSPRGWWWWWWWWYVLHSTTSQGAYNQLNSHWLIISCETFEFQRSYKIVNIQYAQRMSMLCCCNLLTCSWLTHLILIAI